MRILVVGSIKSDVEAIASVFKMFWQGVLIDATQTEQELLTSIEQQRPDLVVLDLAVPGTDSFEMIKEIRLFSSIPIIVIDTNHNESSLIRSFELGADDYVFKPLMPFELLVRAKAIMRRVRGGNQDQSIIAGLLRLHASLHLVYIGEKEVHLTRTENIILRHLMENAGNTVTHVSIAQKVWGDDYTDSSATLRVYIERIRKKLGDNSKHPSMILTETGLGYRLVQPAS